MCIMSGIHVNVRIIIGMRIRIKIRIKVGTTIRSAFHGRASNLIALWSGILVGRSISVRISS